LNQTELCLETTIATLFRSRAHNRRFSKVNSFWFKNFMVVIRRAVDKNRSYTVIFLKGEEPKWIPTSDYEHARILQIYKQDKKYDGIHNDFTEFDL
jgi:hypothetical protein